MSVLGIALQDSNFDIRDCGAVHREAISGLLYRSDARYTAEDIAIFMGVRHGRLRPCQFIYITNRRHPV